MSALRKATRSHTIKRTSGGRPNPCCQNWFCRLFDSPTVASAMLVLLLLGTLALYLGYHATRPKGEKPWAGAVTFSANGLYEMHFRDDVLERFFQPLEISKLKERLKDKASKAKAEALAQRLQFLPGLKQLIISALGKNNSAPGMLNAKGTDDRLQVADKEAFLQLNLGDVIRWCTEHEGRFVQDTGFEFGANKLADLRQYVAALKMQQGREKEVKDALALEVASLEPPISFFWLYHPTYGWVFEVVTWTIFGVLTSATIALILACRKSDYSACRFILLFLKLPIAPVLSIVVISYMASGDSQEKLRFWNLPGFLVLSFALGFATESLYSRMRDLSVAIVGRALSPDEEKLGKKRDELVSSPAINPEPRPSVPKTLKDLAEKAKDTAKVAIENEIVKRKATAY